MTMDRPANDPLARTALIGGPALLQQLLRDSLFHRHRLDQRRVRLGFVLPSNGFMAIP